MSYNVELTDRASRDLRALYRRIHAAESRLAALWFVGIEKVILSLENHPERGILTPENRRLRHLLYKSQSATYRIIYALDEKKRLVTVLHIRHGAQRPLPKG